MKSSKKGRKEFLALLSKATHSEVDESFKRKLEKKLLSQAPQVLGPQKSILLFFNFINMYKRSLLGTLAVLVFIVGIAVGNFFPNTPLTPQLVIDRAYAAYKEEFSGNKGIFYQKALYEISGDDFSIPARKFIEESWENEEEGYLSILRNPQTEEIFSVNLRKTNDTNSPYIYRNIDNFLLLERLQQEIKNQEIDPKNFKKEGIDPRFIILEYSQEIIPKITSDPELSKVFRQFISNGFLRFENFQENAENLTFEMVIRYLSGNNPKKLLNLSVNKTTGKLSATDAHGKELTKEDYPDLIAQLNKELEKSPIADDVKRAWKLWGEQYYCVEVFEDENQNYQTLLRVAKDDPSAYTVGGQSGLKDFSKDFFSDSEKPAEERLYDIKSLKLTPDRIKKILDDIKNDQNIVYSQEKDSKGSTYYVFTTKNVPDALYKGTFYFDENYQLAKEKIYTHDSLGERNIVITYLDQKYLDAQEGEKIFNSLNPQFGPDVQLISEMEGSSWDASSTESLTQTGCYEANGTRLSAEKEKALWDSVPQQAVEELKSMKEHMMQADPFKPGP